MTLFCSVTVPFQVRASMVGDVIQENLNPCSGAVVTQKKGLAQKKKKFSLILFGARDVFLQKLHLPFPFSFQCMRH